MSISPRSAFGLLAGGPLLLRVVGHLPERAKALVCADRRQVSDKPRGRKPRRAPQWVVEGSSAMAIDAALCRQSRSSWTSAVRSMRSNADVGAHAVDEIGGRGGCERGIVRAGVS